MKRYLATLIALVMMFTSVSGFGVFAEETVEVSSEQIEVVQAAEETVEETVEEPVEETAEETVEEPVEETAEETVEEPVEETAEETVEEPVEETVEETVEEPVEETVEETVEVAELAVELTTGQLYARANEKAIAVALNIAGGQAGYQVEYQVYADDALVYTESVELAEAGEVEYSYMPEAYGVYTVKAVVADAAEQSAEAVLSLPVSAEDPDNAGTWEEDAEEAIEDAMKDEENSWPEWLLAVAQSQIGYQESSIDFIIDEDGAVHGKNLYGADYEDWCADFAAWCLDMTGISTSDFPQANDSASWKNKLENCEAYVDDEDNYEPQQGDLVFFNLDGGNAPQHVGIVRSAGSSISVIEGTSEDGVCVNDYKLSDDEIVGYGSIEALMTRAGVLTEDTVVSAENAALVLEAVNVSSTVAAPGETITWTAVTSGGSGGVQCNFVIMKDGAAYQSLGWQATTTLSFTPEEEGTYKLQVRAKDSSDARSEYVYSAATLVDATVDAPVLDRAYANLSATTLGNNIVWTVSAQANHGAGALQYNYVILKENVAYDLLGWKSGNTITYTPTEPGTYKLQVRAKDSLEQRSNYVWSAGIVVVAEADPLVLESVKVSSVCEKPGTEITWTSTVSGGIGQIQYNYVLMKDNASYKNYGWSTSNTLSCVLEEEGYYRLQVRAKDKAEARSEYVISDITVIAETPDPLLLEAVVPSETIVLPGTEVTWTSAIAGGAGGWQYNYTLLKNNEVFQSFGWSKSNKLSVLLEDEGSYKLMVRAKDSTEARSEYVYSTVTLVSETTELPEAPVLERAVADVSATTLGNSITWTVNATEGLGYGNMEYNFVILKENVTYEMLGWQPTNTLTFTPTEVGTYKLQVRARDSIERRSNYVWSAGILVVETAEPLVLETVEVSSTKVLPETEVVWTANATGGIGTIQYNYVLLKDGVTYQTATWTEENTFTATLTELGTYSLQVRAKDKAEARSEYVFAADVVVVETIVEENVYGDFTYTVNDAGNGIVIAKYAGSASSVTVPATIDELPVTEIGDEAFYNNTSLVQIDLPDTVERIGVRAFAGCTSLSTMN